MPTFIKIEFSISDYKLLKNMALRDPGMREFTRLTATEEIAIEFAREHGLLLTNQQIQAGGMIITSFLFELIYNGVKF